VQVTLAADGQHTRIVLHPTATEAASLPRTDCQVWTGPSWSPDDVHPDLLALALLLLCRPAVADELQLPRAVSPRFAAAAHHLAGLTLSPVDDQLAPRTPPAAGVPGLCFSGGIDSVAALTVLPSTTRCYFLERRVPEGGAPRLLSPEAGLASVEGVRTRGRAVRVVPTDLEYLRDPPGFPEHYANAVPALLHADVDHLATIGWGLLMESAYRIGRARFVDYLDRAYNRRWHGLFAAAGLPMWNPVMGVSEVGTAILAAQGPYEGLAQSCVRAPLGTPCGACVKCFRKLVVGAATSDAWPDDGRWRALLRAYPVRRYLATVPLHQPAGLLWSLQRYPGRDPVLLAVRERLEVAGQDVSFVAHWYPPAQEHWPSTPGNAEVVTALDTLLGRMSTEEEATLRAFDLVTTEVRPEVAAFAAATARLADRRAALDGGPTPKPSVEDESLRVIQEALHDLERRLTASEARAEDVLHSTSYRLGHALVRPVARLRRRR
jgi:hypothetical protein